MVDRSWGARCVALVCAVGVLAAVATSQQQRVYISPDDHTDLFWTADDVAYESAFQSMLDFYLNLADSTSGNAPEFQSRWSCDGSYWLWVYERKKSAAQFQRLIDRIKDGHISVPLNALATTLGAAPAEMVLRGMYYPGRIERRYGVEFPLAYQIENQTFPLGLVSLWAGSGARYSWKGICGCDTQVPNPGNRTNDIYLARGLDGSDVLMKWNSLLGQNTGMGGYAECRTPSQTVDFVTTQAAGNGFAARYPFDVIGAFGKGWDDFQTMTNEFVTTAQSKTNASRKVIVSNETDFFEDFEATYNTATLPVESVSYGNEWELYSAGMAEASSRTKRSLEKLRTAEALAAIESQFDATFMNGRETARDLAFMNWGLFYEHDFGMVFPPTGTSGVNKRIAWQNRLASEIEAYVDQLYSDGLAALAKRIPSAAGQARHFVFNPLGWERTGPVDLAYPGATPVHVVDVATQVEVPSQVIGSGAAQIVRILATDVPSVGYRVFEVRPGAGAPVLSGRGVFTQGNNVLENEFYRVTVAGDGAITSLIDKTQNDREFAKQVGGRWLNDLGTGNGTLVVESSGPVSATLRATSAAPVQHTTRVTMYRGTPRVDIANEITQNFQATQIWSFGVELSSPRVRHEEVGAILTARRANQGGHYATSNARYDWLSLNHFLDVSSGTAGPGLTLSNWDCGFFKLGNSTTNSLDTGTQRVQVLAGGRVANGNNGLPNQGGDNHFLQRFALRTHTGYDATAAMQMALEHQNPLVAGLVTAGAVALPDKVYSALTVSDQKALLWAFKPAEENVAAGLIVRLWNVADTATAGDLQLAPFPVVTALQATHIETDTGSAAVGPQGLAVALGGQQMKTFRVLRNESAQVYCTAKTNSFGCVPAIAFNGMPSKSAGSGFTVSASNVRSGVGAVMLYGTSGRSSAPFQGGTLCVATPLRRVAGQNSMGTGGCTGTLSFDFNSYASGASDPALIVGATVNAQYWSRDQQASFGTNLTNAVEFTLGP